MPRPSERAHHAAEAIGDQDAADGVIVEEEMTTGTGDAQLESGIGIRTDGRDCGRGARRPTVGLGAGEAGAIRTAWDARRPCGTVASTSGSARQDGQNGGQAAQAERQRRVDTRHRYFGEAITLHLPDHIGVATCSARSTLSVSASGNTVEERKHCEGLGRCILGFTRIEADSP
jgi:hypothetical protein